MRIAEPRQFFLWSQGQLQALLPHPDVGVPPVRRRAALELPQLPAQPGCSTPRCAPAWPTPRTAWPCVWRATAAKARRCRPCSTRRGRRRTPPWRRCRTRRAGSASTTCCCTAASNWPAAPASFALFGLPHRLRGRDAYFLELLLPTLHLSVQRLAHCAAAPADAGPRPLSGREVQILYWGEGGQEQRRDRPDPRHQRPDGEEPSGSGLYRVLGVSNRTHAIARCMALRLLAPAPPAVARAA